MYVLIELVDVHSIWLRLRRWGTRHQRYVVVALIIAVIRLVSCSLEEDADDDSMQGMFM